MLHTHNCFACNEVLVCCCENRRNEDRVTKEPRKLYCIGCLPEGEKHDRELIGEVRSSWLIGNGYRAWGTQAAVDGRADHPPGDADATFKAAGSEWNVSRMVGGAHPGYRCGALRSFLVVQVAVGMTQAPVIICRFVAHGVCTGCAAQDVRVHEKTLTCFSCTGKLVAIEDKKQKLQNTLRQQFLDVGAEIKKKVTEFNRA